MNDTGLHDIFEAVKARILDRLDSLNGLEVLSNTISFEGWLKVEAINAINKQIDRAQNRGSDLKLNDGSNIELKASMDPIHKYYFHHKNGSKYSDPVLVIAGGNVERLNCYAGKYHLTILEFHALNASLVMALVKP